MPRYIIKNGVCMNPDTEILWEDKKFRFQIEWAFSEKVRKWNFGCEFEYKGSSCGCCGFYSSPSFTCGPLFDSLEQARTTAIAWALDYAKSHGNHPSGKSVQPVIEKLKGMLYGVQLNLFN